MHEVIFSFSLSSLCRLKLHLSAKPTGHTAAGVEGETSPLWKGESESTAAFPSVRQAAARIPPERQGDGTFISRRVLGPLRES